MECQLVWLFFLCVTNGVLTDAFVWTTAKVSPARETWREGMYNSDCHLLGRELITDRLENVRVRGVTSSVGFSNEYWIGAHVQYTKWIRFNGCYRTDIQRMTSNLESHSIIECNIFCGGASFGLAIDRCVCLDNPEPVRNTDYCLASPCPMDVGDFCGAGALRARNCLCWYDIVDLSSDNEIGNCKTMTHARGNRQQLRTTKCSEKHSFLCKGTRFSILRRYRENMNWTEAGFACHREHESQFYNGRYSKGQRWSGRNWVGLFRKQLFIWGNDTAPGTEWDCLSASVSKNGKLTTFVRKCYSRLPLLCDAQPDPQFTLHHNVSVYTDNETVQSTSAPESGRIGVISLSVGVVCGILVTLVAVIISVMIYRCRKNRIGAHASSNRQDIDGSDTMAAHYEHIIPENREGHIYDVCEHSPISYDYVSTQGCSGEYVNA